MRSFAQVRQFFSPEGRLVNLAVLLGTGFLVVHGAWRVISGRPDPGWLGRLVLGLGLALVVISGRFSARLLRFLLLLSVAVVLLGLVNVGRDAIEQRRLRGARATATALANRVDLATPSGGMPRPDAANSAVAELCRAAGGELASAKPPACQEATDPQVSLATLNDRRANAELDVARYRLSVVGADAKKTLAAEVEAKEAAYAEAVGKRNEGVPGVGVAEAVQAGAGAVLAALPWIGQDRATCPSPWRWSAGRS